MNKIIDVLNTLHERLKQFLKLRDLFEVKVKKIIEEYEGGEWAGCFVPKYSPEAGCYENVLTLSVPSKNDTRTCWKTVSSSISWQHVSLYTYKGSCRMVPVHTQQTWFLISIMRRLTFRHHASYIQDRRTATPQSTLFIYIQSTNIFNYFFSLSLTIFMYSFTKCRVFPNVILLGS